MDYFPGVRLHHTQNRPGESGLPCAGFPHQAQDFPVAHVKGHIVQDLLIASPAEKAAVVVSAGNMAEGENNLFAQSVPSFRFRVGMAAISRWV